MKIKLFADGADKVGMLEMYKNPLIKGFTTNPTLMRKAGLPNGLAAVGYRPEDVDDLVAGTLPQHTVTKLSPRPASADDLRRLFLDSMTLW